MGDIFERALAREAERQRRNQSAVVYPRGYVPRKCSTCGERHAPFGDADGKWYCRAHRPAPLAEDDAQPVFAPSSRVAAPIAERAHGKLIIENMVTGVSTEIDLGARGNIVRFPVSSPIKRERTHIKPILPTDPEDARGELERLQTEADERNTIAAGARITSRFCRCGRLSDLGFEIDGALVWRCHECRGETLEG
jgi:hypothetical protein